jgi:hypothetical protein
MLAFRPAFPEEVVAGGEFGTAQGEDGVGAADGPVHSRAFETLADGDSTAGFDDPGGGTKASGLEFWIPHAVPVGLEVVGT